MEYTLNQARNHLPELVRQAESGTPVTITRHGKAVVSLVKTVDQLKRKRVFGGFEAHVEILDPSWADPTDDVEAWLEGER